MQRQALTVCPIGSMVTNGCMGFAKDYLAAPLCELQALDFPDPSNITLDLHGIKP
jgi:hypothetical protein